MTYAELVEKVSVLCQHAIRGKLRSDVFCNSVIAHARAYKEGLEQEQDRTGFIGSRGVYQEDYVKLGKADDGLTARDAKRLELADDDGKNLLDDGDAFDE